MKKKKTLPENDFTPVSPIAKGLQTGEDVLEINEFTINEFNNDPDYDDLLDRIVETFSDEEILKADGFDKAIIGIDETSMRLIYSVSKCISILVLIEDMTEEDAWEHFSYNVEGSYVGEKTPIWCHDEF